MQASFQFQHFKTHKDGYTLIETLVALALIAIVIAFISNEVFKIRTRIIAANCSAGLQEIETAKNLWRREHPLGRNPTVAELTPYFSSQHFPTDPWGVGYNAGINGAITKNPTDIIDLTRQASHSYNGNAAYEPIGNCGTNNGYNDLGPITIH